VKKIVIIDREPIVRRLIRLALPGAETEIFDFENFAKSFHFIEGIEPDIVLVDRETIQGEEKLLERLGDAKIIVMAKNLPESDSLLFDGVLHKPISPTGLWEKILAL
jgi:DNA-binding NarL/FixJ family response regulator